MEPMPRFAKTCDAEFVVGEVYRMEAVEERSMRSHNHFFAVLHEAWLNLPDELATKFATPTALRKHALILSGYRIERKFAASSKEEARKMAAWIRPPDDYAIISVHDNVVVEWTAKSQSRKAMGGPTFQKSKTDVLDFIADMLGTTTEALTNARAA